MPKQGCPCKGCTERVADPNCHGTCARYILWAKENAEERERKIKEKLHDYYIRDMKNLATLRKFGKRRRFLD